MPYVSGDINNHRDHYFNSDILITTTKSALKNATVVHE